MHDTTITLCMRTLAEICTLLPCTKWIPPYEVNVHTARAGVRLLSSL